MTQILLITNPFNPLDDIERLESLDGITPRDWLRDHFGEEFGEFAQPTVLQWNGELVMRDEWETREFEPGDIVAFVTLPQGPITAIIVAVVVGIIVGVVAYLLIPKPTIPGEAAQGDSVYTLRGQTNRFRPNEPIEVVYGRCRHWPTYAARPYSEYVGNLQYQHSLYCLGQGEFDIHALQIDNTPLSDFAEVEYEIIPPGGTVNLIESAVFTNLEVANIELLGPNQDDFTGPSGPFTLNDFQSPIHRIAVDISFPQGLYNLNDEGNLTSQNVELLFEYREIDEDGDPIGDWLVLENPNVTRADNTPQRITFSKFVEEGRYQIRGQRVSNRPGSTRVASQVRWESAKGYARMNPNFGNVTMIATKVLATNSLNDSSSRSFNIIATRKLRKWHPVDGWGPLVATRNPIWAFCDIFRSTYGGKLPEEFLDMPSLYALANTYETRGDWFDWIFDGPLTVWEAARMAVRVGRALPVPQGSLISAVRDVPQSMPSGVFNQHNIIKGTLKKTLDMFDFQPFDSVIVEYTDSETWQPEEVLAVLPGQAGLNPERIKFPGCTSRNKALQEGLYLQARRQLQRKTVVFQTGLEGHIPAFMDLISVTHDTVRVGQGGMILDYDIDTKEMTLSEQVDFATTEIVHKIAIRGDDGAINGSPISVTPGNAPNKVILAEHPEGDLDFSQNRVPPLYAFGIADIWSFLGKVTSIRPMDENTVEIACVNYAPGVYTYESSESSPLIELGVIRNQSNPKVQWVTISPVPENSERVFVDWLPVAGAASYILQTSYDNGESWNMIGNFNGPPVEIGANAGTLIARVAPFALGGNVIYTQSEPFVVGSNITPPPAPIENDFQPDFFALVATVRWGAVSGASGYIVEVYTDDVLMRTFSTGSGLQASYSFDNYVADGGTGREIEFRVAAFNAGGSGDQTNIVQINLPPVEAPSALAVGSPTGDDYPATWEYEPEGDELEFRVYASETDGFTPGEANLVATRTVLNATITAATLPLYWRVGVVDKWGPEVVLSAQAVIE